MTQPSLVERVARSRKVSHIERAQMLAITVAYPDWAATATEITAIARDFEEVERTTIAAVLAAIAEPSEAVMLATFNFPHEDAMAVDLDTFRGSTKARMWSNNFREDMRAMIAVLMREVEGG